MDLRPNLVIDPDGIAYVQCIEYSRGNEPTRCYFRRSCACMCSETPKWLV